MTKREDRGKAAARAEIALRYNYKRRTDWSLTNLRVGELRRLYRSRLGMELSKLELDNAIFAAAGDFTSCSANELGDRVALTFEERVALNIRSIRCFDVPEAIVKERQRESKRLRDRDRLRSRRQHAAQLSGNIRQDGQSRAVIVLSLLSPEWVSVVDLSQKVKTSAAFLSPQLKALDAVSRRQALHRALKWLAERELCMLAKRLGRNALPVMFVRLLPKGSEWRKRPF